MSTQPVRVRIAPSPTGDPHVGTAYQALINHAFARSQGGAFVLRIEDTDRARSSASSEAAILESLRWLGIDWDEGPDVGGVHGPYRQSERLPLYHEHVNRLLASGHAYRDFSTREELIALREQQRLNKEQSGYDQRYRDLDPTESEARVEAGEEFTVRLRVPVEGACQFEDFFRGTVERDWSLVDDQILLKSDGFPTYHLANVVDDHLMEITHVIRGEEWLNSVPKHVWLYRCLGWEPPRFCHLPLLRNNDANRTKLSKRKNPTSIGYYRDAGFLPEALVNFLGLLARSAAEGEEKISLEQWIADFQLEDITLGGPVFDVDKLRWLNARYIREDYDPEQLVGLLHQWGLSDQRLARIAELARPRLETLSDWGALTEHFFTDAVELAPGALQLDGYDDLQLAELLMVATWRFDALPEWSSEATDGVLRALATERELKLRDLTRPFYVAVSGRSASTPLFQSMEILGRDIVRMRLRRAIDALGGLSGKRLKALEKRERR